MYAPHNLRVPIHFLIFRIRGGAIAGRCVEVGVCPTGLAGIPLIEAGHLRGQSAGVTPGWVSHGSPHSRVALCSLGKWWELAVDFQVLPPRAGVGIGCIITMNVAIIEFVTGVHIGMFPLVAACGELPVTTIKCIFERLFPCVSVLVDLEDFWSLKTLSRAGKWQGKGFLLVQTGI